MSIDPADKLRQLREKEGYTFPLLMDPASEAIGRFGILNQENGKIPHPTTLVIDREGVIRFARTNQDYKQRPSPEELLEVLRPPKANSN